MAAMRTLSNNLARTRHVSQAQPASRKCQCALQFVPWRQSACRAPPPCQAGPRVPHCTRIRLLCCRTGKRQCTWDRCSCTAVGIAHSCPDRWGPGGGTRRPFCPRTPATAPSVRGARGAPRGDGEECDRLVTSWREASNSRHRWFCRFEAEALLGVQHTTALAHSHATNPAMLHSEQDNSPGGHTAALRILASGRVGDRTEQRGTQLPTARTISGCPSTTCQTHTAQLVRYHTTW